MHSLGILLSGRGSNFVAIAESINTGRIPDARIAVVISNRADAPGIATARERGLNALIIPSKGKPREEHDREVVSALTQHRIDLVCLAGYMRLLSPWFVRQFPQKILNIHPSLLPAFPGLEAQEQAFAYGAKISGCTVDHGPIIVQKAVAVLDNDSERTLAARILEQEHIAYTEAVNVVLGGEFEIVGRRLIRRQK
jgi:phosphoribosylglycinamide formyltransferase 1